MSDRDEIQELISLYSLAISRRDFATAGSVFSSDASWEVVGTPFKLEGPTIGAGLKNLVESTSTWLVQRNSPAVIQIDGERARATSLIHEVADVEAENKHVEMYGVYEDELAKRNGKWLFRTRSFNILNMRQTPLKG